MEMVNGREFCELKSWVGSVIEEEGMSELFGEVEEVMRVDEGKYEKLRNVKK